MTRSVVWLEVAAIEAQEARRYYDAEVPTLGTAFIEKLFAVVARVAAFPLAWQEVEGGVRRALVDRFPYVLHYTIVDDDVLILGVHHLRRKPISFSTRIPPRR